MFSFSGKIWETIQSNKTCFKNFEWPECWDKNCGGWFMVSVVGYKVPFHRRAGHTNINNHSIYFK